MENGPNHFPSDGSALRLVDALPMGILVVGSEGLIAYANERAHSLLGATLVGVGIAEVFVSLDQLWGSLRDGRQSILVTAPHSRRKMEVGFQLSVLEQGLVGPERFLLVFQDITEINRLRSERDRLLQIAAVGDVLPSILHEIKNPLASIRTSVELLVEEASEGSLRDDLYAILNEIRRIALTLEGVGGMRQDLRSARTHAVDQACREVFSVVALQARDKGVRMSPEIPSLPLLPFDPPGIRAIVYNLLNNSLFACGPGGCIELRVGLADDALEIGVSDTGKGMTPEVLQRCKELFFTTKAKGTGIGLALCTSLVESAGGSLQIESTSGAGTRVLATVPLVPKNPIGGTDVKSGRSQPDPEAAAIWYA